MIEGGREGFGVWEEGGGGGGGGVFGEDLRGGGG